MATTTLKYDARNANAKKALDYILSLVFFEEIDSTELNATQIVTKTAEETYNPKFVAMVKKAQKRGNYKEVDPKDIWGSLGLK